MRKTIKLEAIDPIEIFGAGNKILEEFCSYFPELKVVARGDEIILDGKESRIEDFEVKFAELVQRRHRKMNLTVYDVEDIFDGENSPDRFRLNGDAVIVHSTDGKPIRARNLTQQEMVKAYFDNDLVFAVGPAGTGKTYVAIALAVRALKNREIKRIILTRPAVEAGERLGFLPGDLKDKLDPYLQPLYDALGDMIPPRRLQEFITDGIIQTDGPPGLMAFLQRGHQTASFRQEEGRVDKATGHFLCHEVGEVEDDIVCMNIAECPCIALPRWPPAVPSQRWLAHAGSQVRCRRRAGRPVSADPCAAC